MSKHPSLLFRPAELSQYLWSSPPLAHQSAIRGHLCQSHSRHTRQNLVVRLSHRRTTVATKRPRNSQLARMKNQSRLMKTIDNSTRSSKVFAAGCTIANPFLLCRVTAVYARRLQRQRIQFAESINQSLRLISGLPHGHMDTANLPLPVRTEEETPEIVPALAATL